jgi:hypothetical protein
MTPEQYAVIRKLLRGDFPKYPTPATDDEHRWINFDGSHYCVSTLPEKRAQPVVRIYQDETFCCPIVDGIIDLDNAVSITREQCDQWDDEQREELRWADKD